MQRDPAIRLAAALVAVLLLPCALAGGARSDVAVFLLDAAVDDAFVRGDLLEHREAEVTHGSLVARVLARYCSAPVVSLTVEGRDGSVSREEYIEALERVARTAESSPGLRAVVNISLASAGRDPREEDLIRRLCDLGVLVVAAAGNDGSDQAMYPAALDGVIAVASATRAGKAPSSNFGPHVDLCASGDITFIDYDFVPYERLHREMEARGTSFAAPRVAATVAFVLQRRPGLSPAEAFDVVAECAAPIDDDLYRRGLLGAGLLDVRRAQMRVAPGYGFLQYTLPWIVCAALICLSAYMSLRYGSVGVFVSLLLWLVALPLAFVLALGVSDWLLFLGGGSRAAGVASALVLAAGVGAAGLAQGRQVWKGMAACLAPAALLTVVLAPGRVAPGTAVACSAGAACLAVGLAVLWERRTARILHAVRGGRLALRRMVALHGRTIDSRLRQTIREQVAATNDADAVGFFLSQVPDQRGAVAGLAAIAGGNVGLLLPWLRRLRTLTSWQRRVLLLGLERGAGPEAPAALDEVAEADPSGRIGRLARRLRDREPSEPAG
jgi:hypothetical protein